MKDNARTIEDIAEGSLAFALDPGRIYLNLKGRYPAGVVERNDSRALIDEIKQGLSEISANGRAIVKRIYERDEIFSGPLADAAPDLCVQPIYGYDLKGAVNKQGLMDRDLLTGMHTQDDATLFISAPRNNLRSGKPHITDVAPTILASMGLTVPEGMDGRSMFVRE